MVQSPFSQSPSLPNFGALQTYKEAKDAIQIYELRDKNIERLVQEIASLVEPYDAFDLIELMRMRELNPIPDPRTANPDGAASHIEIVAAVLLTREGREGSQNSSEGNPSEIIESLHQLTYEITQHSMFSALELEQRQDDHTSDSFVMYQTSRAIISNFQFDGIRDRHDKALLDHEIARPMVLETLGYTLDQVKAVRDAINEIHSTRLTEDRDVSGDGIQNLLQKYGDVHSGTPEENQVISEAMISMLFRPGSRATILVSDVAEEAEIPEDIAEKIISDFSIEFDPARDATETVRAHLKGDWEFVYKPLVRNRTGEFALVANGIGDDTIRRVFEEKQKANQKLFKKYDQKVRAKVTEELAGEYLGKLLKPDRHWLNINYAFQVKSSNEEKLDENFDFSRSKCEPAESDGLFLIDDVAIVVEVKGKSISDKARTGHRLKFDRDIKDTVDNARSQVARLTHLIRSHSGIWLSKGKWLDLSRTRKVFSIVVTLDDVGPIGTLGRNSSDDNEVPAWVVSLHDLAVMSELFKSSTEFLAYVSTRIEPAYEYDIVAVDELDILTDFLAGSLFLHSDEARLFRRVPILAPTNGPIDVWMRRHEIPSGLRTAPRPRLEIEQQSAQLIRQIIFRGQQGYMSASIELLLTALADDSMLESKLVDLSRRNVDAGEVFRLKVPAVNNLPEIVLIKVGQGIKTLELGLEGIDGQAVEAKNHLIIYVNKENEIKNFKRLKAN